MGFSHKRIVLVSSAVLLVLAVVCEADFGAQDLMRQARALKQQPLRPQQKSLRPQQQQQQQRILRPAANRRSEQPQQPLSKRSNDLNRFSGFGLTEGELNNNNYRPAAFQGYQDSERDGARYDRHGNRQKHANADYADRRSEQTYEPEPSQIADVPRQQYRYPNPNQKQAATRKEREPEKFEQNSRIEEVRQPAQVDFAPTQDVRRVPEPVSRSDDPYAPASGPAYADSSVAASIPHEQRDIEAAIVSGANAFGIPTEGVYQTEDRLSFQIHGQQGPHSYKYGYDTGNGYNRQFRYEERNGEGYVKGRYGFFDTGGKLQVVNYSADPLTGFHAEGSGVPEYPH